MTLFDQDDLSTRLDLCETPEERKRVVQWKLRLAEQVLQERLREVEAELRPKPPPKRRKRK